MKAIEIAPNCYAELLNRFAGKKNIDLSMLDILSFQKELSQSFDSVVSVNVFEHIENDYLGFINVNSYLKPGGVFILFVPAFQILYGKTDYDVGHFRRYNKKDLVKTLEGAGFSIIKVSYVNLAGFFSWLFYKNKDGAITHKNIRIFDCKIVPIIKNVERCLTPPIGQSLFLVAKKVLDD